MIRIFTIVILFILYGNLNAELNDMIILSLINIAFFTILKEKKIKYIDISIFILSTFVIEVFVGLPILIGFVFLFIPLILVNNLINNYNLSLFVKSLIIFLLSLITFYIFDQNILFRLLNFQYLISILIITTLFYGLLKYGKK
mgnify:CR=1 FL=1